MDILLSILLVILGLIVGIISVLIINQIRKNNTSKSINEMLNKAQNDAEKLKKDYLLEGKEEIKQLKEELEKEIKEKKNEIKASEDRLIARENNMDRRDQSLQTRENLLEEKENNIINKQKEIQDEKVKLEELRKKEETVLEEIAGYSKEEARKIILKNTEEMMDKELANYIKDRENEAKLEADKKSKALLVTCMQRYSADVAGDQTVTVVSLPNEEMKGRIIGREGRNIRTIEAVTGVDLIIDDTPEAIVVSSFDPLRREIARVTIESLIKDGRIHPSRIEELYEKVSEDMKTKIREYGESALFELGINKMEPELVELIGKLHFRTSYGQNALKHSLEVAHLTGILASEIGENEAIAKRAGLLHDIGKAIDHDVEGSHVTIGADIAKRYKENETVIDAIESHHGDTESTSVISTLVQIADALSASRPGARNDSLENYIKRLEQLENMTVDIKGIEKSYALQAGRELRILVKPEEVDDLTSHKIAREIKEKIEKEMQYPGTIKITVIRETRVTEEAK